MTPAISVKNLSKKFKLDNSFLDAFFARFSNVFQNIAIKRSIDPLKNISFDIMPGETVGIIGKNGAGKTTLLKTIAGIPG